MSADKEQSAGLIDLTRSPRSASGLEDTELNGPTSDDTGVEDYDEEEPRKSRRPQKPTEKARQVKAPSIRKKENALEVPIALDKGRFPRDRRVWTPHHPTLLIDWLAEAGFLKRITDTRLSSFCHTCPRSSASPSS